MSELVPKLRFGEFINDSIWKLTSFSKLFEIGGGKDHKHLALGDIPVYGSGGYMRSVDEYLYDGKSVCIGRKGTINKPIFLTGKFWTVDTLFYTHSFNKCVPEFIFLLFQNIDWLRLNEAGGVPSLSKTIINKIEVLIPDLQEQQKIADFLTSVDRKISQLTEKHRLLTQYKKGVMQQIFSQQLRFKDDDGSEFREWETIVFGKLFNWVRTNNLSRDKLTYTPTKIQNIHYGDIHMRFPALFDQAKVSIPYVIEDEQEKLVSQADFCKLGDIVIADASEDYADIGKTIEIVSIQNSTLVSGLHTYIARPINEFALGYMGYLFQYSGTRYQIKKLAQGVSVLGISKTNLEKIELPIPNIQEQQKIAQFLQAIDVKIDATSQQLEQTKLFKKGLLQQMFV